MVKSTKVKKLQIKIILFAALFGFFASLVDAFFDAFFFYEGTFMELAFTEVPSHEIYIRSILFVLVLSFGIVMSFVIKKIIIAERALLRSKQSLELAVKAARLGLWGWDLNSGEMHFNDQWARMIGYEPSEIVPTFEFWKGLIYPDDVSDVMKLLEDHIDGKTPIYEAEHRVWHKDGSLMWVLDTGRVVEWDEAGEPIRAAGTLRDITRHKLMEEELWLMASTDMLTGVANRREGLHFLEKHISLAERTGQSVGLCFLDVNKFKEINDTHGHEEGDRVLRMVSDIVSTSIRKSDFLMRFGGDEFVIIMPGGTKEHAELIWSRIVQHLAGQDAGKAQPYTVSLSHGFAEYQPGKGKTMNDLIREADVEMYRNKKG